MFILCFSILCITFYISSPFLLGNPPTHTQVQPTIIERHLIRWVLVPLFKAAGKIRRTQMTWFKRRLTSASPPPQELRQAKEAAEQRCGELELRYGALQRAHVEVPAREHPPPAGLTAIATPQSRKTLSQSKFAPDIFSTYPPPPPEVWPGVGVEGSQRGDFPAVFCVKRRKCLAEKNYPKKGSPPDLSPD